MQVGIVGLPGSGKTAVFDAITRGREGSPRRSRGPAIAVARVDDPRLCELGRIAGSARTVPAEITFLDPPTAADGLPGAAGIGGRQLTHLQGVDALAVVVRSFEDPSVPHVLGRVDAAGDAAAVLEEMALADLEILERRLERISAGRKGAGAEERAALGREEELLGRVSAGLEDGIGTASAGLSPAERSMISGFGLLTSKPVVIVANLGESQSDEMDELLAQLRASLPASLPGLHESGPAAIGLFGRLELDLSELEPAEELEFREHFGMTERGSQALARACLEALGMITFFTAGPKEARARTVRAGTSVRAGAGVIHSDMERGFIRAEIVTYDDYVSAGGEAGARRRGLVRRAGADHPLRDGDVVRVLFSV